MKNTTSFYPRVFTLANQKGGVGKTTTAINLGTALAAIGERVLIVDLDPQGNASTGLGIERRENILSTYEIMTEKASFKDVVLPTSVPNLWIAPSNLNLLGVELQISSDKTRLHRLKEALYILNSSVEYSRFNYILIDCPPSLNLLTINSFVAANAIIVPLQCEFFALEGLSQLLKTIHHIKVSLNDALEIHGVVLTMYDSRNNLSEQVVRDVRDFMGQKVYDTVIPRNVRVSESPSYGKPVLLYDLKSSGAQAYLKLASEVIRREKSLQPA